MPTEITRYNRGGTSFNPLIETPNGTLMLSEDVLPVLDDMRRLDGVVQDLNASVEELTRILAAKNDLINSTIDTYAELEAVNRNLRAKVSLCLWLIVSETVALGVHIGKIKGWW